MHFILHADLDEPLGAGFAPPRRSYYSVLQTLLPAFEAIGSVDIIRDPITEVDTIFDRCVAAGEECVFFSFASPHRTPLGLRCPIVPVVVWEYSTIPSELWDEAGRSDWRVTLAILGSAVAVCNFAARAIKQAMGDDFPVSVVPVAVWDKTEAIRARLALPTAVTPAEFYVDGRVLDSRFLDLSADLLLPATRPEGMSDFEIATMARSISIKTAAPPPSNTAIKLDGVVYTLICGLSDERKNPHDILTAFCYAFRETDDATLVIKIVHWDKNDYHGTLVWTLSRLAPFKCRVIFIQAFLNDEMSAQLIGATSYYVSASHCESVAVSLMEYMACGRPAVAPRHSAMEDYIDDSVAFVVGSSSELSAWPQDPRKVFRCERYRIDWESLRDMFSESYRVAKNEPERRRTMGLNAMERMRVLTATDAVAEKLRAFLTQRSETRGRPRAANAQLSRVPS